MDNNNNRIILLYGEINEGNIKVTMESLLTLINTDNERELKEIDFERKPIHLHINSYGGNIDDMWSLISLIKTSPTPIHTHCTGYAYSAAFLVFLSGTERTVYPYSKFMYHSISSYTYGSVSHIKDYADLLNAENKKCIDYIVKHTKISPLKLSDITQKQKDWFISSDEAIDLGVANNCIC